jgi:hypothetical protein
MARDASSGTADKQISSGSEPLCVVALLGGDGHGGATSRAAEVLRAAALPSWFSDNLMPLSPANSAQRESRP